MEQPRPLIDEAENDTQQNAIFRVIDADYAFKAALQELKRFSDEQMPEVFINQSTMQVVATGLELEEAVNAAVWADVPYESLVAFRNASTVTS